MNLSLEQLQKNNTKQITNKKNAKNTQLQHYSGNYDEYKQQQQNDKILSPQSSMVKKDNKNKQSNLNVKLNLNNQEKNNKKNDINSLNHSKILLKQSKGNEKQINGQNNNKKQQIIKKEQRSSQKYQDQEYEQNYQEQFQQQPFKNKSKQIQYNYLNNQNKASNNQKTQTSSKNIQKPKFPTSTTNRSLQLSNLTSTQKINKYKQLVEASFPQDQTIQNIQKLKPQSINRLNDKIRDMIKGFSNELSNIIDKNLLLLRNNQNQIKEEIEGETDPITTQIKLLIEKRKNNIKMLEISEKQLQNVTEMVKKFNNSVQNNVQLNQDIQLYKNNINLISKQITNLKNQVQKQGKKVINVQDNNKIQGSKQKNSMQIRQKIVQLKLQIDKNNKRSQELEDKIYTLQSKIQETSQKKTKFLQKAQKQGYFFHTKQEKAKYQELKKKRQQLALFSSKFNASIKSKQTLIQKQLNDIQVLISEYEQKFQKVDTLCNQNKNKMLNQIKKGKLNAKVPSNIKEVLVKLQEYITGDYTDELSAEDKLNSLNFISDKIYKRDYKQASVNKNKTEQAQIKKIAGKISTDNKYIRNQNQNIIKTSNNLKGKNQLNQNINNNNISTPQYQYKRSTTVQLKNRKSQDLNQKLMQKMQNQKQKQRIWKQSQSYSQNPFKKDKSYSQTQSIRYVNKLKGQEDNPLKNKQIIKLIDRNKQKIVLKQEQKIQNNLIKSKPFSFKSNHGKDKQDKYQNQNTSINMNKIDKIQQQKYIIEQTKIQIPIRLQIKQSPKLQNKQNDSLNNLKSSSNINPFQKMKLKNNQKQNFKEIENKQLQIQKQFTLNNHKNQIKQQLNNQEQTISIKPKRFNLRKKNQNSQNTGGYIPSIQNQTKKIQNQYQNQQKSINSINISQQKSNQGYNPFKNFLGSANQQQKSLKINDDTLKQLKLPEFKQNAPNKPTLNLFKKQKDNSVSNLNNLSLNLKAQQTGINLRLPQKKQQNIQSQLRVPRQGRLKKLKPALGTNQVTNKNIYDNVDDITQNNILSINQPQSSRNTNKNINLSVKNNINSNINNLNKKQNEKNLNELLGIKKNKNNDFENDLLIDQQKQKVGEKKINIKSKPVKNSDFFNDLEI